MCNAQAISTFIDLNSTFTFIQHRRGRMGTNFVGHGAECVKRRAIRSVKANPNCAEKAAEYVDAAFDRCFKDTFPFDRHPNLR